MNLDNLYTRTESYFYPNNVCTPATAKENEKQAIARRTAGRYRIDEAAFFIGDIGRERPNYILEKLKDAVQSSVLAAYEPGKREKRSFGSSKVVREWHEEVYWDDLNKWLSDNEKRIDCRFPAPENDVAQQDPVSKAQYERTWKLYDELEKWERMEHQNDPDKYEKIQAKLLSIRAELAELNKVIEAPDETALPDQTEEADFLASFTETVYNGKAINWRYWVHQMPELSAAEAARLMCGLEPEVFENLDNRPNKNDPTELIGNVKKMQRLAERQNMLSAPPAQWLEWAKDHGFNVHIGFRHEVGIAQQGDADEAQQPGRAPPASPTKNIWDEYSLRRLLDESRAPGMTHEKLAEQYRVKRQLIGRMLKKAEDMLAPKKARHFDALSPWKPKK